MSNDTTDTDGGDPINPDLEELHDSLVTKVITLSKQIAQAPSAAAVDAINTEIDEINHRVTLVGNLLFTEQTKGITNAMDKVRATDADVSREIKKIDDMTGFLNTMRTFLTLVDKVIDTAKLVLA